MAEYKREPVIEPHVLELEKKLKKQGTEGQSKGPTREDSAISSYWTTDAGSRYAGIQDSVGQGYLCGPFVKSILHCGH